MSISSGPSKGYQTDTCEHLVSLRNGTRYNSKPGKQKGISNDLMYSSNLIKRVFSLSPQAWRKVLFFSFTHDDSSYSEILYPSMSLFKND